MSARIFDVAVARLNDALNVQKFRVCCDYDAEFCELRKGD